MKTILERIRESLRLNECGGSCGSSDDYDYSCGGGRRKRSGGCGSGGC